MRSLRQAINAKCRDCVYDPQAPGNWRQQTGACAIVACPLWPYRPVSKPRARPAPLAAEAAEASR